MTVLKNAFLVGLLVIIGFSVLNPNPFGNNPDIIWDESYFLTSSLSAIENKTIPGWDFPASGAYYGGPQAYVDTAVLIPVLGTVLAASDFSVTAAKIWVAQNTGKLLYILRLVSGVSALLAILFLFFYFKKREIPWPLALSLTLFLFLLLSNVLVIEFLHTAKVWAFYILFLAVPSALFIANEYYLSRLGKPLLSKERYVALLVWSSVLMFFQTWLGVFATFLLMVYAILLRHISVRDVWEHVKRYWYLIVLFSLTQVSFVYQAYRVANTFASTTRTADGAIDWFARLTKPLLFTIQSQPLVVLYIVGAFALLFLALREKLLFADARKRMYVAIALLHPVFIYIIFYVGIGLDLLPRYAVILTMAISFSVVMLMSELGSRSVLVALAMSGILFGIVNTHGLTLYWRPSSETVLVRTIEAKYNSPENVFITDHSARRMTLPVNAESLHLLDEERQAMSRFAFLLENRDRLPASEFKPLSAIAYRPEQEAEYLAQFSTSTYSVWMIRRLCTQRCSEAETQSGNCFEININACGVEPQEVNALPVFLSSAQLGYSYIVRKIR